MDKNYFEQLQEIDVSSKIEQKGSFSYLSWAYAWAEVKKLYPDANYRIYENKDGWNYHTDGRTAWVKTGVTINGIEHIEELPVLDNRNEPISLDSITSFNVNKAIQRSITKAIARHGLGLNIYAGEDLPDVEPTAKEPEHNSSATRCSDCDRFILPAHGKTEPQLVKYSTKKFGRPLCVDCIIKNNNAQTVSD